MRVCACHHRDNGDDALVATFVFGLVDRSWLDNGKRHSITTCLHAKTAPAMVFVFPNGIFGCVFHVYTYEYIFVT